jgi:hypothetical protein
MPAALPEELTKAGPLWLLTEPQAKTELVAAENPQEKSLAAPSVALITTVPRIVRTAKRLIDIVLQHL